MTSHEPERFPLREITNYPKDFPSFSFEDRRTWVRKELDSGKYRKADEVSIASIFQMGLRVLPWHPNYFMYRMLLADVEPSLAADKIRDEHDARFFLESYGLETSLPYISDEIWLKAFSLVTFHREEATTTQQVKLLLQNRGAERVAESIWCKAGGALFLDIFGVESNIHLPKHIANHAKGRQLEEAIGL